MSETYYIFLILILTIFFFLYLKKNYEKNKKSECKIKLTHEMEIIPLILYYIPYIKVLEPQWLADDVKERVQGYLKEI